MARPEAVGIDIEERLLGYARALVADHGLRCRLEVADVLATGAEQRLGHFDIITCNDVIEHVKDPALALERLVALLADGGLLLMEIPNRHWAAHLGSDGHYQQFGLSALPKRLADRYHALAMPGPPHDVTYKSQAFYFDTLRRLGATPRLLNGHTADLDWAMEEMAGHFARTEERGRGWDPPLPDEIKREARRRVARLADVFRRQRARYHALKSSDPARATELWMRLYHQFGLDFWIVLIERNGPATATAARRSGWRTAARA